MFVVHSPVAVSALLSSYPPSFPLSFASPTTIRHSHPGSQSALAAMGGYSLPSLSTLGEHVHQFSAGTGSMTDWTWEPQPHHDVFSGRWVSEDGHRQEGRRRTTGCAGAFLAHVVCCGWMDRWVGLVMMDGEFKIWRLIKRWGTASDQAA